MILSKVVQEVLKKNNANIFDRENRDKVAKIIFENLGERPEELFLNFLPKEYFGDLNYINNFINSFEFLETAKSRYGVNTSKMLEGNNFIEINEIIKKLDLHIESLIDNSEVVENLKKNETIDDSLLERLKQNSDY